MADDAPTEPGPSEADASAPARDKGERTGVFERYALIAALTLVVLCLLIWDKWHDGSISGAAPRPDRTLRVEIGGGDPDAKTVAPPPQPRAEAPHVSNDAPLTKPAPAERSYTVKGGDNLSDIAKRELGAASRAQEIADLNGLADPSKLKVGQVLKLPAK